MLHMAGQVRLWIKFPIGSYLCHTGIGGTSGVFCKWPPSRTINPVWEQVWLPGLEYVNNWTLTSHFMLITPSPSNMSAWYPLWLEPWQLTLKYLNSATELPSDSVAQLVRAWQAICQVMGSSPYLSHSHFLFHSFFLFISFILTDFDLG